MLNFHQSKTFEPNYAPVLAQPDFRDRLQTQFVWANQSIAFESGQEIPALTAHQAQVIKSGKALLQKINLSVTEIAASLGFIDHSHFTKVFKRMVGNFAVRLSNRNLLKIITRTYSLPQESTIQFFSPRYSEYSNRANNFEKSAFANRLISCGKIHTFIFLFRLLPSSLRILCIFPKIQL